MEAELQRRAEDFGSRLDSQGMALDRYLEADGRSVDQVVGELREQAVPAVKADLALRAVAEAVGIEPSEAEVDAYIAQLASQARGRTLPLSAKRLSAQAGVRRYARI